MGKYYISKTEVEYNADGKLVGREIVLTRPDSKRNVRLALQRYQAIGIPNVHMCESKPSRLRKLTALANKRRKADRELTLADVAADLLELDKEAAKREA